MSDVPAQERIPETEAPRVIDEAGAAAGVRRRSAAVGIAAALTVVLVLVATVVGDILIDSRRALQTAPGRIGSGAARSSKAGEAAVDARLTSAQPSVAAVPGPVIGPDVAICGLPGIAVDPNVPLDEDPRFAERIRSARNTLIDALAHRSDERSKVVSALLRHSQDYSAMLAAEYAAADGVCGQDKACHDTMGAKRRTAAFADSMQPTTDALVRMAISTADPGVYAAAIGACTSYDSMDLQQPDVCRLVSPAQFARLDPNNMMAWVLVASDAAQRKDGSAVDDAMNHIAHASGSRLYESDHAAMADAAIPAGSDEFEAAQMRQSGFRLASTGSSHLF